MHEAPAAGLWVVESMDGVGAAVFFRTVLPQLLVCRNRFFGRRELREDLRCCLGGLPLPCLLIVHELLSFLISIDF